MNKHNFGVIMAGGVGSRFWPMSKSNHPKQFIDILGTGQSLLQQTFDRLKTVCPSNQIYIVTNERYRQITQDQLPEIDASQVLCEPSRRNTAPCIAYANFKIKGLDPQANVVVTPSDHLILKTEVYTQIVQQTLAHASQTDALITIGIKPSRPDTGYGYINYQQSEQDFNPVISFTEKPDLEKAKAFISSGDYSWNSGMFIWNVKTIDTAFKTHLPDLHQLFELEKEKINTPAEQQSIDHIYSLCENISIDYGIMEKAKNTQVINADFGWSDLGTWGSLYEHIPQDDKNNAIVGDQVLTFESSGNIIHVPKDKLLVTHGLNDFIVVDHEDTLLICSKKDEQQIKMMVEFIEKNKGKEFV